MIVRRQVLSSAVVGLVGLVTRRASADPALPTAPIWSRDEKDPRWVQGQAEAAASADAVFTRLRRVPEWPRLFTDIKSLRVIEGAADRWRVKLETKTFDCGAHEYDVLFDATRTGRLWIDAPGITALAYMRVYEGATKDSSRIVYSLFVDARGVAGWFVSKEELRRKQEQMVVRYLTDLERAFRRDDRSDS